jgi:hypothetical protein
MLVVYLAHKFNLEKWRVEEIKDFIIKAYQVRKDIVIINTPVLFGWSGLSEKEAIKKSLKLLSLCDVVWVYVFSKTDFFTSKGLKKELRLARMLHKPVRIVTSVEDIKV